MKSSDRRTALQSALSCWLLAPVLAWGAAAWVVWSLYEQATTPEVSLTLADVAGWLTLIWLSGPLVFYAVFFTVHLTARWWTRASRRQLPGAAALSTTLTVGALYLLVSAPFIGIAAGLGHPVALLAALAPAVSIPWTILHD